VNPLVVLKPKTTRATEEEPNTDCSGSKIKANSKECKVPETVKIKKHEPSPYPPIDKSDGKYNVLNEK